MCMWKNNAMIKLLMIAYVKLDKNTALMRLLSIAIIIFACINDGFCTQRQRLHVADILLIEKHQELASQYVNILPETILECQQNDNQLQFSDAFTEMVVGIPELALFVADLLRDAKNNKLYHLSYTMDGILKGKKNYDASLGAINNMKDLEAICKQSVEESNDLKIQLCFSYIAETLEYGTLQNTYNSINDVLKSERQSPLRDSSAYDFYAAITELSMKPRNNADILNLLNEIQDSLQIKDITLPNPIYNIEPK